MQVQVTWYLGKAMCESLVDVSRENMQTQATYLELEL